VPGKRLSKGITLLPSGNYCARLSVFGREVSRTFTDIKKAKSWRDEMIYNVDRAPQGLTFEANQWMARIETGGKVFEKASHEFEESLKWLKLAESRITLGISVSPDKAEVTFGTYVQDWAGPEGLAGMRTRADYAYINKSHLLPYFGEMKLSSIATSDIRKWTKFMEKAGRSKATIRRAKDHLKQIMKTAFREDYIAKDIFANQKNEKVIRRKARALEQNQVELLVHHAGKHSLMVELHYLTGQRPGELRAMRASDFHLDENQVSIEFAWRTDKKIWELGPTKTEEKRDVPLHESLIPRLKTLLSGLSGDDFLFTHEDGTVISDDYYRKHIIKKAAKAAGVPWATPYTLRHTFASHMIGKVGAPINSVSYLMGHASAKETLNTYAHFFPADSPLWVNKMEAVSTPVSEQNRNEEVSEDETQYEPVSGLVYRPVNKRAVVRKVVAMGKIDPRIKSPLL
jgi:integrase